MAGIERRQLGTTIDSGEQVYENWTCKEGILTKTSRSVCYQFFKLQWIQYNLVMTTLVSAPLPEFVHRHQPRSIRTTNPFIHPSIHSLSCLSPQRPPEVDSVQKCSNTFPYRRNGSIITLHAFPSSPTCYQSPSTNLSAPSPPLPSPVPSLPNRAPPPAGPSPRGTAHDGTKL